MSLVPDVVRLTMRRGPGRGAAAMCAAHVATGRGRPDPFGAGRLDSSCHDLDFNQCALGSLKHACAAAGVVAGEACAAAGVVTGEVSALCGLVVLPPHTSARGGMPLLVALC